MQKQTEGRLSRTSACGQTQSHAILQVNNISALHDDLPSSFFIAPKVGLYCPRFLCLHSIVTGRVQISSFMHKNLSRAFHYSALCPALIHPSALPLYYTGPPKLILTTPSQLFDIMLLWLSGPLCWLLSEADWRPFVCVSPCPEWPGGTCWAASRETGMHIWMG